MINKNLSKKAHQLSAILIVIALSISIISFGFYTENNFGFVNNENIEEITGAATGMESVTGMAEAPGATSAPTNTRTIMLDLDLTGENPQIEIIMGANWQFISASRPNFFSGRTNMDYFNFFSYLIEKMPDLERVKVIREAVATVPEILTAISAVELVACLACDSRIVVDGRESILTSYNANIRAIERSLGLGSAAAAPPTSAIDIANIQSLNSMTDPQLNRLETFQRENRMQYVNYNNRLYYWDDNGNTYVKSEFSSFDEIGVYDAQRSSTGGPAAAPALATPASPPAAPAPAPAATPSSSVTEILNNAQHGQPGFGWRYFSDGIAISPDSVYYLEGVEIYNPNAPAANSPPPPPSPAAAPIISPAPPPAPPRTPAESIPRAAMTSKDFLAAEVDKQLKGTGKTIAIYDSPDKIQPNSKYTYQAVIEGDDVNGYKIVYYNKQCSSCALLKYESNGESKGWKPVEFEYRITGKDSQGKDILSSDQLIYKGSTPQEALKKAQADLPGAVLSATKSDGASLQTGGNFELKDGRFAVNKQTKTTIRIPDTVNAQEYVQELNDRIKIKQAYDNWLKANNYQDTKENKAFFKAHPPADVNRNLIDSVLESASAKEAKAKKEATPVEHTAPDGIKYWEFQNIRYFTKDDADKAAAFKKEHPTATITAYKTADSKDIYLDKGKYILQTSEEYKGEAIKTEKIGGADYKVAYSFKSGKPEPTKIDIEGTTFNLNSNILQQLRSNVGKEDTLAVTEGRLVHTKTATIKEVGKVEDDNYRKSTKTTTSIYNANQGLTELIVVEQTVDNKGNILDKKGVKTTFTYDDKSKKDIPDKIIETTYEKGEDGFVDISKTRILTVNAKTGEPLALKYYDNRDTKVELDLLKTQFESRKFFAQLESALTDFAGLGYYATLFFGKEDLDIWRENVDKAFATLYLGTDYWESAICQEYAGMEGKGVAYVQTKLGLGAVAAHIEASRSEQVIGPGTENQQTGIVMPSREFLYKITFNVKNGDYEKDPKALEKMRFNVVLKGERTAKLFRANVEVKKGDQFGHLGRNAIVQYSNFFYGEICIEFENTPSSWNLDNDELCNTIAGPSGPASLGQGQQQPSQQQESAGGNILDI